MSKLKITTEKEENMTCEKETFIAPVHPGEVLLEDFMKPLELSQNALAKAIGVPPRRINQIIHGKRAISADTAIRLGLFFGTSAQVWLGMQKEYELDCIIYAERNSHKNTFDFIKRFVPKAAMF